MGVRARGGGPDHDAVVGYIRERYPDTFIATAMGATFFSCDESSWPNFATLVTTDEHDTTPVSNLARPGVFRLNISLGRERFAQLVGGQRNPDFSALDMLMPHPVYAPQHWACILNPSIESFDNVIKPLLDEAHERVARAAKAKNSRGISMGDDLAAANVNRSYSLAATSIAIFTFMLIFLYPRFASGEVNALLFQTTLVVMGVATFSFVFASFYYYGSSLGGGRIDDAERVRYSHRGDRFWLLGYTLLFLDPSLILFSVGLVAVGAAWLALWLVYVFFVIRNFPRVATSRKR